MSSTPHIFRHEAMATAFEIRVASGERAYASQAAEEAFRLLDHLENCLSRFRDNSDVSAIANLRPGESVRVSAETFECLSRALELSEQTAGAFDPTLGAEMDRQRGAAGSGGGEHVVENPIREKSGRLILDPATHLVSCVDASVRLDLGAVGKGYAVDKMGELLREWEAGPCLVVGGGSSIVATETFPDGWSIGITSRLQLRLMQGSVGCSGLSVKGSHILDPRTGLPAETPARVWVLAPSAVVSDALSTAFMIMPEDDISQICQERPDVGALIQASEKSPEIRRIGRAIAVHYGIEKMEDAEPRQ